MEELCAAIGKDTTSPELQQLFLVIGIGVKNLGHYPLRLPDRRLWADDAVGLQLEFKHVGALRDIPYHDIGEGPWVLTDIIFWGRQKPSKRKQAPNGIYAGPLPCGLSFDMERDAVRKQVPDGPPQVAGLSGEVDVWPLPGGAELLVSYSGEADGIRCVSIGIPEDL